MEKIYCDLVSWGMYEPSMKSFKSFLHEPTWLIVGLWGYYLMKRTEEINLSSVSTAKMALLLEMGFSSFGGGSNKVVQDIKRYLPFAITSNEGILDRDTIEIFWELNDNNKIPNYFQSALIKESALMEELKTGRI